MALTQLNQLAIAFKKLAGKSHTNSSFGAGNEAVASFIQLGTTTIFGEPIPTTSIPSSVYAINGPVEKVRLELEQIDLSQYRSANPGGLSGATINASGDGAPDIGTFSIGIHAYKLKLASDYEANSSNPKKGTPPFTNNSIISDSSGELQLIPSSFASAYAATVNDSGGEIFPGDEDDYYVDYSTGILFIQDVVSGQPPVYVDAYLYIGKYLADPTLSYSGSFSGSFEGDGSGLTNVPASGVVGLNLTQIATSDVTASVQNSSNIFTVTSASQEVFNITDQGILSGSGANLFDIPASGITGLNLSRVATGSITASVDVGVTSFTVESGSTTLMNVKSDGRIAVSQSINVGIPVANQWGADLDGSYFNNFTSNTDVSTMLRFIAGLLSQSAPDASPNTRTWNNTTSSFSVGNTTSKTNYMSGVLGGSSYKAARLSQEWDQSTFISSSATSSYRELQSYLINKGWLDSSETGSNALHDVGTNPFGTGSYGVNIPSTIYNTFGTFTFGVSSGVTGVTSFSSSLGSRAFGLGNLIDPNTVTPYSINITYTQSFSDTASITTPSVSSTYSTNSGVTYVQSSTSPSNGLYLGLITTVNPKVIPNAYQDGYFLNSQANVGGRKWGPSGTNGNVTSSIGYYRIHDVAVGLSSSQAEGFITKNIVPSNATVGFYAPSLSTLGVQDITLAPPTVTLSNAVNIASFSATSRSLSGAPYISSSAYTITYNTEVSKSFDPCYGASSSPISITKTDSWTASGSVTYTPPTISVTSNGIQTSSSVAGVFPAGGSPASIRTVGSIPAIGDVAFLSSSYSFSLIANKSNVVQNKATQAAANLSLTFRTTGENWKGTTATLDSTTIQFYDATRFGQPSDSGSMAIYSRAQGYDNRVLTTRTESFAGEDYRLKIDDNLLSGSWANGTKFTTDIEDYYNLSSLDLQVKPGYLVRPGGNNGYWLPDDGTTFKYYAVAFNSNDANQINTISLNIVSGSTSHVKWSDTTTNGIACLAIFSNPGGLNKAIDVKEPAISTQVFTAGTDGLNPFTTDISVYKNETYPVIAIGGEFLLDGANRNFVLLIRMKGDVGPITSISYSS